MEDLPVRVVGILGLSLDRGKGRKRWERWRPTVSLFRHDDLLIARLDLLVEPHADALADQVCADIRRLSPKTEVVRHRLAVRDAWDFSEVFEKLHGFASGASFAPDKEDLLVHITTGSHVMQICLFLLTESRHLPGRLLQTSPSRRGSGPQYTLIDLDLSRYDRLAARFAEERRGSVDFLKAGIATRNARFNALIAELEQVAVGSTAPLLLTGPTGAGKTRLARRIFELKKLRNQVRGRFVEVNCATLRGDQAMSALFGHLRGAYTGARSAREGLLREADGGLLFLDEIAELGLDEQAMLLRALEEGSFLPLGGDRPVSADFQLISGSNADLRAAVRRGRFRADLLARIDVWSFRLPGLAERPEDVEPNLDYELLRRTEESGRRVSLTREAREDFLGFARGAPWPGNFRELGAALLRMATLAPHGRIGRDEVRAERARLEERWRTEEAQEAGRVAHVFPGRAFDLFERVQLEAVLAVCAAAPSLSEAGRRLFAESRKRRRSTNDADRLRKYLARLGTSWDAVRAALGAGREDAAGG